MSDTCEDGRVASKAEGTGPFAATATVQTLSTLNRFLKESGIAGHHVGPIYLDLGVWSPSCHFYPVDCGFSYAVRGSIVSTLIDTVNHHVKGECTVVFAALASVADGWNRPPVVSPFDRGATKAVLAQIVARRLCELIGTGGSGRGFVRQTKRA